MAKFRLCVKIPRDAGKSKGKGAKRQKSEADINYVRMIFGRMRKESRGSCF